MNIPDTYEFNSVDVAKYIAGKANEKKIFLNITKIQKLLYIAYGTYLRVYERRLTNEHPQAWPYGPVFPTTRNKMVSMAFETIKATDSPSELQHDSKLNKVVDFTFKHFGTWNAGQLTEWSHRDGSPWYYATQTPGFKWGDQIRDELIYDYFRSIITINAPADETV